MKVFVNDISFEFQEAQQVSAAPIPFTKVVYNQPSMSQIMLFYQMAKEKNIRGGKEIVFLVNNYPKVIAEFKSKFKILHAAGGLVNKGNEQLFIFRLGRWDLPKGKIEAGEDIQTAALREVEEECGVKASIEKPIVQTWHTYTSGKGNEILKCTHWFAMTCLDDSQLAPQTEEDIQEVRWVPADEVSNIILKNTYTSIKDVLKYS